MPISVCIATYNGEKFIISQLESILEQLSESDEIVISDDSSTDETVHLIKKIGDSRIRLFENQTFRNPIFNFEYALTKAKNDVIFLSDQDDLWKKGKVAAMSSWLVNYDVVVCDHSLIDEEDNLLRRSYFEYVPPKVGLVKNLLRNSYFGCCMAFRRKVLEKALPFPKGVPMHDIWLGFVFSIYYRTKFLSEPYTLYRKHGNNTSSATEIDSKHNLIKRIQFRLNLIKYLPRLLFR